MNCQKRVFFTILSIVIIGIAFLAQIGNAVSARESSLSAAGSWNFVFQLILALVIGGVLCFAIYTVIWGGYVCKIVLSILYVIIDFILLFVIIFLFSIPNLLQNQIKESWLNLDRLEKIEEDEKVLKCCAYQDPIAEGRTCTIDVTCKDKINSVINKYCYPLGGIMLVLFILLTVGIAMLIIEAKKDKAPETDDIEEDRFMTPFAYGFKA